MTGLQYAHTDLCTVGLDDQSIHGAAIDLTPCGIHSAGECDVVHPRGSRGDERDDGLAAWNGLEETCSEGVICYDGVHD